MHAAISSTHGPALDNITKHMPLEIGRGKHIKIKFRLKIPKWQE